VLAARAMGLELEFRGTGVDEQAVVVRVDNAEAQVEPGKVVVRIHAKYHRPAEVDHLLGDASLARDRLGWTPLTSFDELVREMAAADFALAAREAAGQVGARHGRHLVEPLPR
jgi:GDPmannose 4,6-dehydratase